MAASSPLSNFLSFLLPKSPLPPQPKLAAVSMKEPAAAPSTRRIEGLTATATAENSVVPADGAAVMWPSMAYTNTLYFRSAYNVQVVVDDNEPEERLLNRFRREVMRAGVIQECKRRRFHENKQEEKKRKTREAAKRNRRRRFPSRFTGPPTKTDVPSGKKEDDDDNWDLPQSVPY